ncbi:MAG: hypothetical protein ACI88A_003856 [Paraglaciecola sp.]|jgi:hypothetical protein
MGDAHLGGKLIVTKKQKTTKKIATIQSLWREWLSRYKDKSIAIYGGGEHTLWLAETLQEAFDEMPIACIIDRAPSQETLLGVPLVNSKSCKLDQFDFIIISSQFSEQEIYETLLTQVTAERIGRFYERSREQVFFDFYEENRWGSGESISGRGSELLQTKGLIEQLPKLFSKLHISSLLDLPCGDFNWMKNVLPNEIVYIGGDIVNNIILENNNKYQSDKYSFKHIDLLTSMLPATDAIFCRDCLVHFSYADIKQAINNITATKAKYLITTSFVEQQTNKDIVIGNWRPLNLLAEPFNFPTPLEILFEGCTESNGAYKDKAMCVWKIKDLPFFS